MSLTFMIEALKFNKLKSRNTIKYIFLIVFLLNSLFLLFPLGDKDLSPFINWVYNNGNLFNETRYLLPDANANSILSWGNIIYLSSQLVMKLLNLAFVFLYGAIALGDYIGKPSSESIKTYLKKIPQILLFLALLIVPFVSGAFLFMLPFYIILTKLVFSMFYVYEDKEKLSTALSESFYQTKGITFSLVWSLIILEFVLSLIRNLLALLVPANIVGYSLITAFSTAISIFVIGRLFTLYYIYYAKINPRGLVRIEGSVFDIVDNIKHIQEEISGEPRE